MSSIALFANNAVSSLAGAITNTSLTANLSSGGGALFPHPIAGQYFTLTFNDAATGLLNEIVWVTNVAGDTVTMVRGQEGTLAQNWSAGDLATAMITAGDLQTFAQLPQVQALATNTGVDVGAVNAFSVALTPAVSTHNQGSPIFWRANNTNTGPSTFNDGAGVLPLVNPDGTALGSGTINPGGYYLSIFDGAGHFQLISTSNQALSSQGIATVGDMKFRPTAETIPGWVTANGLTLGNATSGATGRANADTFSLFSWHWNNFSNTQCPVAPGGRGASPSADFAANKTIQLLAWQGLSPVGIDGMGGSNTGKLNGVPVVSGAANAPGSVLGENLHQLTIAEIPVITASGSISNGGISVSTSTGVTSTAVGSFTIAGNVATGLAGGGLNGPINVGTISISSSASSGSSASQSASTFFGNSFGASNTHNNVSLSMGVTWYLKL